MPEVNRRLFLLEAIERNAQGREFVMQGTSIGAVIEKSLEFGFFLGADLAVNCGIDQVCEFLLYSHQDLPVNASLSCCRAV